jgi:hypothetical protein
VRTTYDGLGFRAYVQDKWTTGRVTLAYGVRFDHFANSSPETVAGPTTLLPTRNLVFAATDGVSFKDVTPKIGAVYDLRGNGKTALKVSLNKYVQGLSSGDAFFGSVLNPINRVGNRPRVHGPTAIATTFQTAI